MYSNACLFKGIGNEIGGQNWFNAPLESILHQDQKLLFYWQQHQSTCVGSCTQQTFAPHSVMWSLAPQQLKLLLTLDTLLLAPRSLILGSVISISRSNAPEFYPNLSNMIHDNGSFVSSSSSSSSSKLQNNFIFNLMVPWFIKQSINWILVEQCQIRCSMMGSC